MLGPSRTSVMQAVLLETQVGMAVISGAIQSQPDPTESSAA